MFHGYYRLEIVKLFEFSHITQSDTSTPRQMTIEKVCFYEMS